VDSRGALKAGIDSAQVVVDRYLSDLGDADLLVRPVPGTNHIAWQLGHIISAEHNMMEMVKPKSMPPLPDGFAAKHSKEAAKSDDAKGFYTKAQYLDEIKKQRAGTLAVLASLTDADLDKPAPEPLRSFLKSTGDVFAMQGVHWMMHAGQWAVLRRKLGKPIVV
jgi:hypothetical protein